MPVAILAGQLFSASLACGLNLYATFAMLGIASRLGWTTALPDPLRGLEHGFILGIALLLLAGELVLSAGRWPHSIWESAHTFVRPVGAAALTWTALDSLPIGSRGAMALAAAALALGAHMAKLGLRVVLAGQRAQRIAASLAEAVLAAGLVLLASVRPGVTLPVLAVLAILSAVVGPSLFPGSVFAGRALAARLRGFFGTRGWRTDREMPATVRALTAPRPLGAPVLAARAALTNGSLRGAWRNGWLVIDAGGAAFVHRGLTRARRIALHEHAPASLRTGLLADAVDVSGAGSPFTLHLLKDGPPIAIALGELRATGS